MLVRGLQIRQHLPAVYGRFKGIPKSSRSPTQVVLHDLCICYLPESLKVLSKLSCKADKGLFLAEGHVCHIHHRQFLSK